MAATGMAMTERIALSKVAAFKRIGKSAEWLRWMAEELCTAEGFMMEKPAFLKDRDVTIYDASDETTRGKEKSTWRIHYGFSLFEFRCTGLELTTNKEGERLTRHEIQAGSIVMGDRIYGTIKGMEHVLAAEADFLLRFKSKAYTLYDGEGRKIDLLPILRDLEPLSNTDIRCFYKNDSGEMRPVRIVAMKKTDEAQETCKRKMSRKAGRKQEKPARADTVELNEYIVLMTSLDYTNEQLLELYRARWQIEMVFHRLKSLFGYGNTPNKREDTVRAWFYGKLLLAALCETILKRTPFPPNPESAVVDSVRAQFMDRIVLHP
jgi:hypothetical protein